MKVLTQKQKDALALGRKKGKKIDLSCKVGMKYKKHKENPTSFKKGNKPWNTGKKGVQISSRKGKSQGYINSHGYLVFYIEGKEYLAHRLIWEKYYRTIPEGYEVHHKDENKLNNDISNLELVTKSEHGKIHYSEKKDKLRRKKYA
jgi:hypothetical protein